MDITWDGLPVAQEWPRGADVVVRRADGDVLLLHRAHNGPDYEGPWGWTVPSGSRQPGEAILPAALRELAEEAGLTGVDVAPVDLGGHWAVFTAQVDAGTRVALMDAEHDRFEWVPPAEVPARVRPRFVADATRRALAVPLDPVTFAPLRREDLPALVDWHNRAHVRTWWPDGAPDVHAAGEHYGPRIDGTEPGHVDVVAVAGHPVGFVQAAPLAEDEEYFETARWSTVGGEETVALDYAIGDPALTGRGIGTRVLWSYVRDVVLTRYPGTRFVVADPVTTNIASLRACEKAGFRRMHDFEPESGGPRQALCVFDRARVIGAVPA